MDNLVGQKFGLLTVIERAPSRNHRGYWKCQCDCGNICEVETTKLKNGHTKSCGCLRHKSQAEDLTGQKFGRLTPVERDYSYTDRVGWICQCDCGNICSVRANDLKMGKTQSCGCLQKERSKEKSHQVAKIRRENPKPRRDLTGQKFNMLTVLGFDEETTLLKRQQNNNLRCYWKCQCECGRVCSVETSALLRGSTKSCGCLNSAGERKVREILTENGISFTTQKRFSDCILPSGYPAFFDFWIEDTYLVEYDGQQHYQNNGTGIFTPERLNKIHESDNYKNQWCIEHQIPLIRIPYTQYDKLSIQDLLLDTTTFRYC